MLAAEDVDGPIAVHEGICAGLWKQADARLPRIVAVLGAIVLLLLLGEGSVVSVINRLLGG